MKSGAAPVCSVFSLPLLPFDESADFQQEAADDDDDGDDEVQRATLDEAASNQIQQLSQSSKGFSPIEEDQRMAPKAGQQLVQRNGPSQNFLMSPLGLVE